jgi:Fic family protein
MREPILKVFPAAPGRPSDIAAYLKDVDDIYVTDAYHSLSIEGYRVSHELVERVRSNEWTPDENGGDRQHRNALAARGYWQAYQAVRESIRKILEGENPGAVSDEDHGDWYREMFGPCVTAGLLRAADLAGYRNDQVYVRRSMHIPPRHEAVRDCMPAFFELLREEPEPSVRVVLGHFIFVYIHPYMDGNGRMGRFLMNVMLAAGGYPWTVIPLEKRDNYMEALERGSVERNIVPFAVFLGKLVSVSERL